MPWWLWFLAGGVLIAVELMGDTAFYLLFIGVAAVLVGTAGLAGAGLPEWAQWLAFSAIAIITMVLFRKKLHDKFRGGLTGFDDDPAGELVALPRGLPVGGRARVEWRGSQWTVENVGDAAIPPGSRAWIVRARGIVLEVANPAEADADEQPERRGASWK